MIELINVSYSYSNIPALNNININISRGESVTLIGANGCGKSTLLKLINGIIAPDSGTYKFNGEEITKKRLRDPKFSKLFHQNIGFVFQNSQTQLFCPEVYDEIAFGPRQMGIAENEVEIRVNDCLELLNIHGLKNRQPYHLSEGEKRKVAIACVLSLNPEVLALDEPLNGLDPKTQRWLVEFLIKFNMGGKTLITSTHNLEFLQEISNRAILFDENHRIAADTQMEELIEDIDLLKKVNLIDEYYHKHTGIKHKHFHIHNY
ncbi:MAG: energy-coupling factor ABC transporter ATP-binding protein [Actinobacteria bacterium]|nr:energy-coupling factor ABC transporter ATP-binding protein [Actinomycetota bacterium]